MACMKIGIIAPYNFARSGFCYSVLWFFPFEHDTDIVRKLLNKKYEHVTQKNEKKRWVSKSVTLILCKESHINILSTKNGKHFKEYPRK